MRSQGQRDPVVEGAFGAVRRCAVVLVWGLSLLISHPPTMIRPMPIAKPTPIKRCTAWRFHSLLLLSFLRPGIRKTLVGRTRNSVGNIKVPSAPLSLRNLNQYSARLLARVWLLLLRAADANAAIVLFFDCAPRHVAHEHKAESKQLKTRTKNRFAEFPHTNFNRFCNGSASCLPLTQSEHSLW